jgi:hypothetical protein
MNIRLLIQNIGTKTLSENCPDNSSLYLISDSERESIMVTHRENEGDSRVVMNCSYENDDFYGNIGLMYIDDEFMFGEELIEYLNLFDLDAALLSLVEGEL